MWCARLWEEVAQIKSQGIGKKTEESWPWQAWLDGRRTLSFHHPGRRFSSQLWGDSHPDLTKTMLSSSAAVPAAMSPPLKPRSWDLKPLASKSVELSAAPVSTLDASLPRFITFSFSSSRFVFPPFFYGVFRFFLYRIGNLVFLCILVSFLIVVFLFFISEEI